MSTNENGKGNGNGSKKNAVVVAIFHDDPHRVAVGGRLTSPSFLSKGAAQAYADAINAGSRKPEFSHRKRIKRFDNEYRFLSNFVPSYSHLGEESYCSVEHAYQAAKSSDPEERANIASAPTPGKAKRLGRRVRILRSDWEQVKERVMLELLREKFKTEPYHGMLVATGDAELVEGNDWGDVYWGVCDGKGLNRLGILLMQVRAEIWRGA
jgi:ribA/ribD-fused uncharacterized protein